jgi:RecB family endonuclease NucS
VIDAAASPGLTAYRSEWVVWGDEEWLAGCIDFVAMQPDGHLVIIDWKRSKALSAPQHFLQRWLRNPCYPPSLVPPSIRVAHRFRFESASERARRHERLYTKVLQVH